MEVVRAELAAVVARGDADDSRPARGTDRRGVAPAPEDPTTLAGTVRCLLDDEDARARLRQGASVAARHFAWPRIAEAALSIYGEAIRFRRFRRSGSDGPAAA